MFEYDVQPLIPTIASDPWSSKEVGNRISRTDSPVSFTIELDFSLTHQGGRVITRLDILPSSPLHDRVRLKLVLRQCYLHMSGHV